METWKEFGMAHQLGNGLWCLIPTLDLSQCPGCSVVPGRGNLGSHRLLWELSLAPPSDLGSHRSLFSWDATRLETGIWGARGCPGPGEVKEPEEAPQAGGKSRKIQEQAWNCLPVGACPGPAELQPSLARWTLLCQGADGSGQAGAVWDPGNLHSGQPQGCSRAELGNCWRLPKPRQERGSRWCLERFHGMGSQGKEDCSERLFPVTKIPCLFPARAGGAAGCNSGGWKRDFSLHGRRFGSKTSAFHPCAPQSLTEERITLLLQLIGEELEHKGTEGEKPPGKVSTESLQVQVPACILALCGWTCR